MIIWLASYPRSGNTLFRLMLQRVFGCRTYTKYLSPKEVRHWKRSVPKATDWASLPESWAEWYGPVARDQTAYLVKTHDGPEDGGKAIYIVRNGLAAVRSYKYYLRDFNAWDYSLEQIILGETLFRSWGWHLDAWNPLERPNTLVVRYEDLIKQPDEQLQRVAQFTGFTKQAEWVNEFDKLHADNPKLYRQGPRVTPEAGFTEQQQQLFLALHGDWMVKLGYCEPKLAVPRAVRAVLSERLEALSAVAPNRNPQTGTDEHYRHLKKHWWIKLGRNTGLLSIRPPST